MKHSHKNVPKCLEKEKMTSGTEGNTDDSLNEENTSPEGPGGESTEHTVIVSVEIITNHCLQETSLKIKKTT